MNFQLDYFLSLLLFSALKIWHAQWNTYISEGFESKRSIVSVFSQGLNNWRPRVHTWLWFPFVEAKWIFWIEWIKNLPFWILSLTLAHLWAWEKALFLFLQLIWDITKHPKLNKRNNFCSIHLNIHNILDFFIFSSHYISWKVVQTKKF